MTNPNTLEAGPRLDLRIHDKVMGLPFPTDFPPGDPRGIPGVPKYSRDLSAAFNLVADIRKRYHCCVEINSREHGSGPWGVNFYDKYQGYPSLKGAEFWGPEAETLPLAICLAALKVIGL